MYNCDIKKEYIQKKTQMAIMPSNYLNCQFEKCSFMENLLGKDISNFTAYEIQDYYKLLGVASIDSLVVMNSQFSMYTQWCLENNLVKDNQNHFLEIDSKILNMCVNKALFDKRIISRKDVIGWLDQLPNPKDQFILLALFEGIKGKDFCEISKLRTEDLDIKMERAILCTGRKINLSPELSRLVRDCIEETIYYSVSGECVKTMPLIDNGYVVKDYPNTKDSVSDFQLGRKIYNSISRSLRYVGAFDYMTANGIFESGKITMINDRAKYYNMTSEQYIYSKNITEVEQQYNCSIIKSSFVRKYGAFLE